MRFSAGFGCLTCWAVEEASFKAFESHQSFHAFARRMAVRTVQIIPCSSCDLQAAFFNASFAAWNGQSSRLCSQVMRVCGILRAFVHCIAVGRSLLGAHSRDEVRPFEHSGCVLVCAAGSLPAHPLFLFCRCISLCTFGPLASNTLRVSTSRT